MTTDDRCAPWGDELEELPTITVGHDSDLKYDDGRLRVWLSRLGLEDGEPFARTVYVEELKPEGWWLVGYFDGGQDDPHPIGTLGDAWNATGRALEASRTCELCGVTEADDIFPVKGGRCEACRKDPALWRVRRQAAVAARTRKGTRCEFENWGQRCEARRGHAGDHVGYRAPNLP